MVLGIVAGCVYGNVMGGRVGGRCCRRGGGQKRMVGVDFVYVGIGHADAVGHFVGREESGRAVIGQMRYWVAAELRLATLLPLTCLSLKPIVFLLLDPFISAVHVYKPKSLGCKFLTLSSLVLFVNVYMVVTLLGLGISLSSLTKYLSSTLRNPLPMGFWP
ncbi:hypothetical protein BpHYR1_032381 [Brachionus plicatilis]|uniref:Uncharacterized protein n=1 Tax=Brachionus plicatilis TaxID=10195 RepID=A0A3M7SGM5_BRAPC|nr:hypothetical protein BpHYR1_032381 [Brachionus plicatilis]